MFLFSYFFDEMKGIQHWGRPLGFSTSSCPQGGRLIGAGCYIQLSSHVLRSSAIYRHLGELDGWMEGWGGKRLGLEGEVGLQQAFENFIRRVFQVGLTSSKCARRISLGLKMLHSLSATCPVCRHVPPHLSESHGHVTAVLPSACPKVDLHRIKSTGDEIIL